MKILVPRFSSSKGCDPFECDVYKCDKYSIGKKKKGVPSKKGEKGPYQIINPHCGRFRCGKVTIPEHKKDEWIFR